MISIISCKQFIMPTVQANLAYCSANYTVYSTPKTLYHSRNINKQSAQCTVMLYSIQYAENVILLKKHK